MTKSAMGIPQYKAGDTLVSTGQTIKFVVGQDDRLGVFITADENIRYELYPIGRDVGQHESAAIGKLGELASTAKHYVSRGSREDLRHQLAYALHSALRAAGTSETLAAFAKVEEEIVNAGKANASYRYLIGSLLVAFTVIVLALVAAWIAPAGIAVCYGAIGGSVGALLSVLLRLRDLSVEGLRPLWFAFIYGGARALLGALFGIVLIVAMKANIVLGVAQHNAYAIHILAIAAGFSERLAPELLKSIEAKQIGKAKTGR